MAVVINGTTGIDTIQDDAVGLAQMASGTDGNLITYDASGDPAAVAVGTSGQVLTSNGAGAAPTMQAGGKVLQVVIVEDATSQVLATTTYTDTGLSVSITPSATDSKILCQWNMEAQLAASEGFGTRLLRDSTTLTTSGSTSDVYTGGGGSSNNLSRGYIHLDSPSTTSAITYKVQAAATGSIILNTSSNNKIQLMLMEIGA